MQWLVTDAQKKLWKKYSAMLADSQRVETVAEDTSKVKAWVGERNTSRNAKYGGLGLNERLNNGRESSCNGEIQNPTSYPLSSSGMERSCLL